MNNRIRVLVADDSPFICRLLSSYLHYSSDFQVVGTALNGIQAFKLVKELRPDVVTLDLEMPGMVGLEVLQSIMQECPTPVVVISGISRESATVTLQALKLGAIDFIMKCNPAVKIRPDALRQEIVKKVRAASQIRVIRSLSRRNFEKKEVNPFLLPSQAADDQDKLRNNSTLRDESVKGVVVIGASTGGPLALCELLSNLPDDFSEGIIIVQHMPGTFTRVLSAQLSRYTNIKVKEAEDGDLLEPNTALVAPGDYHMLLGSDSRVKLSKGPEVKGHRPSIDVTMQSVAQVYGSRTKGVLLTGMGDDGSMGMVFIRSKGGKTYLQDKDSCVVSGMPQSVIEKGGVVDHIGPPWQIAKILAMDQLRAWRENKC